MEAAGPHRLVQSGLVAADPSLPSTLCSESWRLTHLVPSELVNRTLNPQLRCIVSYHSHGNNLLKSGKNQSSFSEPEFSRKMCV